jgi:hypothetical protein
MGSTPMSGTFATVTFALTWNASHAPSARFCSRISGISERRLWAASSSRKLRPPRKWLRTCEAVEELHQRTGIDAWMAQQRPHARIAHQDRESREVSPRRGRPCNLVDGPSIRAGDREPLHGSRSPSPMTRSADRRRIRTQFCAASQVNLAGCVGGSALRGRESPVQRERASQIQPGSAQRLRRCARALRLRPRPRR